MTARDFCYWLQGYFELACDTTITQQQVATIKNHLSMVFLHDIDPQAGGPEVQKKLNTAHGTKDAVMRC